jgi:hypothetical protein
VSEDDNERKLLRLIDLLGRYAGAKFREDEWWPGNAGGWLGAELGTELAELLDFAADLRQGYDDNVLRYDDNSGEYYDSDGSRVSERGVLPDDDLEPDDEYYDEDAGQEVDTETGRRW